MNALTQPEICNNTEITDYIPTIFLFYEIIEVIHELASHCLAESPIVHSKKNKNSLVKIRQLGTFE